MYCENCGTKLEENANFCGNCGNKTEDTSIEKIEDNEILLSVKPTFNYDYFMLPYLFIYVLIAGYGLMFSLIIGFFHAILFLIISFIILVILMWLRTNPVKKQYENIIFNFYKTKVIFKDNYLNTVTKEIKYKNIKEITMRQTYSQKKYNLGTIVMYTNVEGHGSSTMIADVENVQIIYNKIKKIINL